MDPRVTTVTLTYDVFFCTEDTELTSFTDITSDETPTATKKKRKEKKKVAV